MLNISVYKFYFLVISTFISSLLYGQLNCESYEYLKKQSVNVQNPGKETWFKFRSKGALLDFAGNSEHKDSLFEYEIYPFSDCIKIQLGDVSPIRSVLKKSNLVTEEIWTRVIEEGICACPSCLSKIDVDYKKPLRLKQGEFYLLKVLSYGKSFGMTLNFREIDTLNPIRFSIDSIPFEEIEIGMVYQLREMFFVPAKAKYLEKSIPELKKLELFLKKHKVLKVQVRGHVNGPAQTAPLFYQSLSDERALAIKQFLVENGVDAKRVDAKGMSNFQMRYPSPKDSFQAKENRRVEIVILAIE
tara:strand:- start:6012 stop:6914 length:903 start_codon:yes stop_codon:yes gene_type:complete